ncbi:MAG: MarR family transcriptional regulator [Desulfobacteraceae bacterium]|jgi:DNA-binding MarR family transcriptional regulator
MENQNIHSLHEKFSRIVQLAMEMEKVPRTYGTEFTMTNREIHLIELIGDNEEKFSVTDLAKFMGVTKGAISQTLKKLENRGFVVKQPDPSNLSRVIVTLTSRGKTAYYSHRDWHETMDGGFKSFFTNLSDEKREFLAEVLDKMVLFYKKAMK